MTIGLAVMRLQPLTKGHQKLIDLMLAENEKAVVVIGSANTMDERNPYSYMERRHMVETVYASQIQSGHLIVLGANDIHNPPQWATYIQSLLPVQPTRYYCGRGQDADLFKNAGFQIREINRTEHDISATSVRSKMAKGDNSWKYDVPPCIFKLLNERRQYEKK